MEDNSNNIFLIVIIGIIIFAIIYVENNVENNGKTREKYMSSNRPNYKYSYPNENRVDIEEVIDDVVSFDGSVDSGIISKDELNPNFLYIQFHSDYRDVITALHNIVPDRRQRFNLANIPLEYSEPQVSEVKNLISDFLGVLNENLKNQVPDQRNAHSGWDEAITDPTVEETGWEKVQKSLGLATSLYEKPAKRAPVKLIKIQYVQKYETDDEVKYSIDLVIQKVNVEDQMVIKTSFVQDKRPLHNENNFFVTKRVEMKVIIEDIFVTGYLSKDGNDARLIYDGEDHKFYDYNQLEYNNMTDPKYVQKILMEKYKKRTEEMESRNAMLDEEGQKFHRELPHIYDFSNYRGTQTIFDDMNRKKTFI